MTGRSRGSAGPAMEDGLRAYAVGDVHGHYDLLLQMTDLIRADLDTRPAERSVEIYLGDYIDRGPNSREVLDHLLQSNPVCDERFCLLGNHEDTLLKFLDDAGLLVHWERNGAFETLDSYGVEVHSPLTDESCLDVQVQFAKCLPDEHLQFLRSLPRSIMRGDYFFAHAGVRPGVPLDEQTDRDLMWIREPFLVSDADHGKLVVHGHTPVDKPEFHPNRINIDTCAYGTGVLTCLVLEGTEQRLISSVRPAA